MTATGPRPTTGCWIDLAGNRADGRDDDLDALARRFGLHELAVEDARHAHQRPKLERYGDTLLVVAKPAIYDDDAETIRIGELLVFVGRDFVVSVRHGVASEVVTGTPDGEQELVARHPAEVLYELLDTVVDAYQPILAGLEIDIEEIEREVFSVDSSNPAPRIYALKRQVLELLRNVEPLIEPLDVLARGSDLIGHDDQLDQYFRDVGDHVRRLTAQVRTFNDILSDALQANLAQVSVAQNDDMRRMSAWAAIFLVPTLLAGLWGMNFEHMPEQGWRYGYPLAIGVMVAVSVGLWFQFRRIGWLGRPRR